MNMNNDDDLVDIAGAMRRPGPDCPDDESLRQWLENRDQLAARRAAVDPVRVHVESCPRCGFEIEELEAFFAPLAGAGSGGTEIEEQLRAVLKGQTAVPRPARLWVPNRASTILAMAAALAVGFGLLALIQGVGQVTVPTVPSFGGDPGDVRASAAPVPVAPLGPQALAPHRLVWTASDASGPWQVRLERVDGSLIWSTEVRGALEVVLPPEARVALQPGARYQWRVAGIGEGAAVFSVGR